MLVKHVIVIVGILFPISVNAQVAPAGIASKIPGVDFTQDFRDAKGKQQYPCNPTPDMLSRQKIYCETPLSRADIIASALNTPDTDAQGKPAAIDVKHSRNLALAYKILNATAPVDLTQEQRDNIKEAVFFAYKGSPWTIFPACMLVASEEECAVGPGK